MRLNKAIEEYLTWARANLAFSSWQRAAIALEKFANIVGLTRPISMFTPAHLEGWKITRLNQVTKSTVNREFATVCAFFKKMVQWERLRKSPCEVVNGFRVIKTEPRFFSKEEMNIIISNAPSNDLKNKILVVANSGIRKGELINLTWDDVRFDIPALLIQPHNGWSPKNGAKRAIPMNKTLYITLWHLSLSPRYVFHNGIGKPCEYGLGRKLRIYLKSLGLYEKGMGWHTFRHTFASHHIMNGTPVAFVAKWLGHSDIKTTQIYIHLGMQEERDRINVVDFR